MKNLFIRVAQFVLGAMSVVTVGIGTAYAQTAPSDVQGIVTNIQSSLLVPILNVIVSVSYLAGAGFIVAAIFKFKAHKDNPTQVTIGTPVMMLFVGVGLLFFPVLVQDVMKSIGFTSGGGSLTFNSGTITT